MNAKPYVFLSALVFTAVALAHLSRLLLHWPMVMGSWTVPGWVSIPGLLVPATLAIWGFRLARR